MILSSDSSNKVAVFHLSLPQTTVLKLLHHSHSATLKSVQFPQFFKPFLLRFVDFGASKWRILI